MAIDVIARAIAISGSGGADNRSTFLGNIDQNTVSFPTTRSDGKPLVNGDYLKVSPTAVVPFTIEGLTFSSTKDQAVYIGGQWMLNASAFQNTAETPLKNASKESLNGLAKTQYEVNVQTAESLYLLRMEHYAFGEINLAPVAIKQDQQTEINITYTAERHGVNIQKVSLLKDGVIIQSHENSSTESVKAGGSFTYKDTINKTTNYTVQIIDEDGKVYSAKPKKVDAVSPKYYGVASDMENLIELPASAGTTNSISYNFEYD